MWCLSRNLARSPISNILLNKKQLVRSYKGGIPGCNLPFKTAINNPVRFTAFYLVAGIIGFGAPWFVIMHSMLRPYDYVLD